MSNLCFRKVTITSRSQCRRCDLRSQSCPWMRASARIKLKRVAAPYGEWTGDQRSAVTVEPQKNETILWWRQHHYWRVQFESSNEFQLVEITYNKLDSLYNRCTDVNIHGWRIREKREEERASFIPSPFECGTQSPQLNQLPLSRAQWQLIQLWTLRPTLLSFPCGG